MSYLDTEAGRIVEARSWHIGNLQGIRRTA